MDAIWQADTQRRDKSAMATFAKQASELVGQDLSSFAALHHWSVQDRAAFWQLVWSFCDIKGDPGSQPLVNGDEMKDAKFFPEAKLNFAQNLLWKQGGDDALVFRGEDKLEQRLSWDELRAEVSRWQQAFTASGLVAGDRVAAMMPNMPATIAAMLAVASIGAIWSSCSPDFGVQGVMDRFGQIRPRLFIACDGYWYAGKKQDCSEKISRIVQQLKPQQAIIVPYLGAADAVAEACGGVSQEAFLAAFEAKELEFAPLPFSHPLYILFSSGTTGVPKCIVHSAGGTLLQHVKEHRLHADLGEGDRLFYFTTCGWMMWNWLVSGLASGVTLLLYDGSPFHPDGNVLFDYAQEERMSYFGTSAKYLDALAKSGLVPGQSYNLSSIRTVSSTGSPLSPDGFAFVYENIKPDVHLASISGGTDIVSCFVLGVPLLPVYKGQIQGPGLGMAVEVRDDDGSAMARDKGELVCTKAFPSMPIGFWNDEDGTRYHNAYFARFDNVWCHGDFAEWTEQGGMIIHGRSDATLNPGGVRIGTAEIYNQVEKLAQVQESICIGQQWDNDVRVVLFVVLADGQELDEGLIKTIKTQIRTGATPRHVPAKVIAVKDIPRTKSGKITELAVRDVVHGRTVKNKEALANPQALDLYKDIPELQE